uniref:LAGLIDADG endonuclease n=1 Tax=Ramaria cf. rubripermanens TaxID=2016387 RepID=UPI0022376F47|nr:LAGLIDADG endonuclease [Ramaria cf. rubripermanens]UYR22150.1 LAGLIDADG endonuclease [Ramaria cf. rubripermanens]
MLNIVPALNLANCWELLHIKIITQSAGNLLNLNLLGLFRDYTPELIYCLNLPLRAPFVLQNKKNFFNFSYYLTGLIEGDGTIIVPKTERSIKGRLNYPSIQIVFHLKDLPLALLIHKNLGHGSISRKKGVNAYILTINDIEGLILIVHLINGKLRTPKIYAFQNLIDWLNNKNSKLNLKKQEIDSSNLMSNSWLSGFIEADGHFSVRTSMASRYPKLECKFELSQRQIDHNGRNNLYFLENIAIFLLTVVKSIRMDRPNPQYRIRTTSLRGNIVLEDYFNRFPLFGTKYLDYKDWLDVLNFFKLGEHTNKSAIEKIISIKSNMNDKRINFIWDHLQNFYNLDK